MIDQSKKLHVRRKFRQRRRQVEDLSVNAEEKFEKHFQKRVASLFDVRRFVLGWIGFLILLSIGVAMQMRALGSYYQKLQPVEGGIYSEGMVGSFTNASPLYATGLIDNTVSRLVFAGLLKYDSNNQLVGDLAEKWEVGEEGKIYKITLRPDLKWQDGQPLTAQDVLFTFKTIQNPDAKSPLFNAWKGVDIEANDERTITFKLPTSLAPFVYSLTTGIVPEHILQGIKPEQLRSSTFNTSEPVGAGPFAWDSIEIISNGEKPNLQNIGLKANKSYHLGSTKLDQFVIKTFETKEQMIKSFQKKELNSIVGLDTVPDQLSSNKDIIEYSSPLTAITAVFFKTDSEFLADVRVRQALVQATDVHQILSGLGYPVIVADSPLLKGQVGYSSLLHQSKPNLEQANKLLDEAGWVKNPNEKFRTKDQKKLTIKLFAQNNADYSYMTQKIQNAWQNVGVDTEVTLPPEGELKDIIDTRDYDAILYGISIGVDPDVFAYWHSSQADPRASNRLNFSNYKSAVADKSLEAGRSRVEESLRAAKYVPFLQSWTADAPALTLYQPRFLYITNGQLFGFDPQTMNVASDRFNNVHNWEIIQSRKPISE